MCFVVYGPVRGCRGVVGEKCVWLGQRTQGCLQEATLLKDGSDVAVRAGVASVDVDGGGGTSGRRWKRASGLVDQTGNVDAVVLEGVVGIGSVIPLDMCELTEI